MDIWQNITPLRGRILKTHGQGKPFTVVAVNNNSVVVRPHSTKKERPIPRDHIESAYQELVARGRLSQMDVRAHKHSEASVVYVTALLATLPGVSVKANPVVLHYKK